MTWEPRHYRDDRASPLFGWAVIAVLLAAAVGLAWACG